MSKKDRVVSITPLLGCPSSQSQFFTPRDTQNSQQQPPLHYIYNNNLLRFFYLTTPTINVGPRVAPLDTKSEAILAHQRSSKLLEPTFLRPIGSKSSPSSLGQSPPDTSTNSAHRDDDVAQIQRVLTKRADPLKIRPLHSSIKHQARRAAFYDLLQLQSQKTLPLPRFFEDKMHHHCNALLSSFTSALAPQALPPPTIPAAPHPIPSPQPITSPHSTSTPSQHLPSQNSDLSNPGQLTPYQLDHYFIDQSVFSPAFGSGNITLSSSIFPLLTQSNTLSEPQSILFNALDFNNTSRLHNRDHFRSTNSTHLNIPQINDLSLNHHPDLLPALHPSPPQSNPAQPPSPLNAPPPTIPIDIYNLFLYNYWSFIQYLLTQYSLQIYPRALTSSLTSIPPHLHYDFNRLYTHLHLQELSAYLTLNMRLKNKPLYSNLSSHPMLPQFQHCYSLQTLFSFYNSPLGISVPIPTQVTYIPYLSALVLYPHPRYLVNQQTYSALQHATIHDLPHLDELQPSPPSQCLIETRNEVDLAQPTETLPSPPQSTPHSSDTSFPHITTTTSSSNLKSPFPPHTQYNNAPIAPAVQSSRPIYEYYERVQQQHRSIFSKTWATQKNNPISFPNIPKKFSIPLHQVTNTHIDLTQSWYSILWVPVTQSSDALHHYAGNFLTFHSFELLGPSPLLSPTYFGNHIHPNHDPHAYLLQYQLLAQKQSQNKLLRSSICSTCYPHSGPFSPQSSSTTQLNSTSVSNNLPTTPRSQTPSQTLLQGVGNVPNTDPQNHQQQQPVTSLPINSQQNQNQNQNQPQFTFTNTNTNCAHSQQHIIEIPHLPFSNHNHNFQSSLTDPTSSLLPSFSHSTLSSALSHTQTYAPQQLHHDHQCQQCSYMFMSPELKYARLIHLIRANYAGFSANPDSAIFDSIIHNMTSPSRLQTDPTLSSLNLNDFDSVLQFLNAAYTERNFQTTAMPEFDFTPPNQQTSNTQTTQAGLTSSAVTPYNPANAPSPSHHTSSDQQPQYGQNANYPMEPELGSEKLGVLKGIFGATDRFLNSRTGALHQFYAQQHQQSQYGTQNVPQKPPHLPPHLLPLYQLSRPTTTFSTHNSLNHLQFPHFYPSNIAEPYRLFNFADSHLEKIDLAAPTCDASILFADSMVHKYAALAKLSEEIDTICGTNDHYDRCTAEQPQTSQQYSSPSPLTQSRQGHDASTSSPIPSSSVSSSDSPSTSCSSSSSDFFSNSDLCFSTESEDEFSASGVENSESSSDVDSELHHHTSNRNHHSGNSRNKCLVNSQHSTANTASNCNRIRIDPTVQQAVIQDMEQLLTVPCYIPVIGYVACGVKPFIWFNPLTPPRVPNNITVTNRLSVDQLQAFLPRTSQQLWVSLKNSRQSQNQESFGQKYDNKGSSSANSTSGAEKDLFPNIPFYHQPDYADVITSIIRTSRTRVHSQEISQLIQSLYAYCDASSRDHDDDGGDGNKTRPDHELFQLFDEISALLGLHKKAVTSESNSRHRGDGDEVYRFLCRNPTCKKEKVRVESRNQADSQQRQFHTLASLSSSVSSNPHQRRTHSQHFVYDNDCDEMEEEDMSDMFYDEPTPRSGQFMLSATDQLSQHSHKSHDKTESKSAAFSTSQDQLTQPDLDSPLVHLYLLTHPQMVILNTNDVDLTKREKIKKNQLLHQFPLFKSYQDERGRVPISELNPLLFNTLAHDPAQYTHIIPPPVLSPTSQLSNVAMTKQIRANSHHLSASKFPADGADPVASFSTSDLVLFLSDQVTSSLSPELSLYQVADLSNTLSSCSGSDDDSASTNAQSISQPSTFAPHSLPHGQSAISPLSANNHSTSSNFTKSHANSLLAGPTPVNISDRDTSRSSYMPSAKTLPSDGQLNRILTPYENSIKERVGRIVQNSPQPLQLILSTHSILDQISLQSQSALYNTNILQNATSLIQPISSPYGTKELVQYYFSNPPPAYSAPAQPGDKTRSTTQFNTNATPFTQPKPLNQAGFPASTAKGNPTTTAQPPTPTSNATNTAQLKLERSSSPASAVNTKATHTTTSSKIIPIALPQSDDVSNLPVDSPNPSSSHQPSTTTSIASAVHSSAILAIIPPSSPKSQTSSQTSIATGTSALNPPPSSNTSIIPTLNSRYAKYSAQMESHPFTTISFETLHTLSTMDYLQYINSTRSNYPFFSTIRPHFFPQSSHQKESESHPAGKPLSSKLLQLVTQAQQQQKARHELCVFPPAEWVPALASIENRIYWEILPSSQLHTTRPDANINTNTNSNMNTANGPQSPNPSSQTQNPLSNNSSANTNNNSNGMFRVNSTGHGGTGSSGTTTSTPFTPAPRLTYTAQQLQHFAQPLVNAQYFTPQQFILSSQQSQELLTQQQQPASSHFGPTSTLSSSSSSSSSVLTPLNNLASPSPAIAPLSSSSYQPNNQLNNPANNSSYQYQSFPPYPKFIPTILPPAVLASDRLTNPPNVSTQPLNANLELHHYLASSYQHAYNTSGTARQPHYPIGLGYNDRIYSFDLHPFLQHNINGFPSIHPDFATAIKQSQQGDATAFPGR